MSQQQEEEVEEVPEWGLELALVPVARPYYEVDMAGLSGEVSMEWPHRTWSREHQELPAAPRSAFAPAFPTDMVCCGGDVLSRGGEAVVGKRRRPEDSGRRATTELERISAFVEAMQAKQGENLVRRDEELALMVARPEQTEHVELKAAVRALGGRRTAHLRGGEVTASVSLAARQATLLRTYRDENGRQRRRPHVVVDLGDENVEAELRAHVEIHEKASNKIPLWQTPLLVVLADARDPAQLTLLDDLQRRIREIEKQGTPNNGLLDAARSVVFIDPADVVAGLSRDTSHDLLKAVLRRSSVSGLRLLQHLAAKTESFPLRVHKRGGGTTSSDRPFSSSSSSRRVRIKDGSPVSSSPRSSSSRSSPSENDSSRTTHRVHPRALRLGAAY